MSRAATLAAALGSALALLATACGGASNGSITVLAASSLTEVLPVVDESANYSFGGSDFLAAQVREDVPADVFLAASTRYATELAADGFLEDVRVIARNRLVIVVQAGNPSGIANVADLARPGLRVIVAGASVPVGEYTRAALETLGASHVLDGVASNENDVKAVVGKVALGEADAGIAYATDVAPVGDRVEALQIPDDAQPGIEYRGGIISGSSRKEAARAYLDRLTSSAGRDALSDAGFALP